MTPMYVFKFGFKVQITYIKTRKIYGSIFQIFKLVYRSFQAENKLKKGHFSQKIFLLADISIEVILKISFLSFDNTNVKFAEKKLI